MKKISHGGNIYKKAKEMGIREEDILVFLPISVRLDCQSTYDRQW